VISAKFAVVPGEVDQDEVREIVHDVVDELSTTKRIRKS
jgi:hypothetical protein